MIDFKVQNQSNDSMGKS